jgi:ribosomal protein S18 acetylase RimI-like enzyme
VSEVTDPVRLTSAQTKRAGETLARAFQDDPLFTYFIPDAFERQTVLPSLLAMMARYSVCYGEAYATSPRLEGVACWFPPGQAEMTLRRILRIAGISLLYYFIKVGAALSKYFSYTTYAGKLHERHTPGSHWYLSSIGVDPRFQGKGLASQLLRPMLSRIDQERLPCFLETQTETNVSLYQHFGFQVVETGTIPRTDLTHWAMLREITS